jgi:hypothetical protein
METKIIRFAKLSNIGLMSDIFLIRKGIKIKLLIGIWLNEYPYKRYPKQKFVKRFDLMIAIEKLIDNEIEKRNIK